VAPGGVPAGGLTTAVAVQSPRMIAGTLEVAGTAMVSGDLMVLTGGTTTFYGDVDTLGNSTTLGGYELRVNSEFMTVGCPAIVTGRPGANATALEVSTNSGNATSNFSNGGSGATIWATNNSSYWPTIYAHNAGSGEDFGAGPYGGNNAVALFGAVGDGERWGVCTDGRIGSLGGLAHFTQVATHGGPRVATSPLSLDVEVHASGIGRMSGGQAYVAFDDAFADLVVPDGRYRVLATPLGRCGGLFVAAKEARGFRVECGDPEAAVEFDWLVVALKRGGLDSSEAHPMPARIPRPNGAARERAVPPQRRPPTGTGEKIGS
jgi:hypothetical protein